MYTYDRYDMYTINIIYTITYNYYLQIRMKTHCQINLMYGKVFCLYHSFLLL